VTTIVAVAPEAIGLEYTAAVSFELSNFETSEAAVPPMVTEE
jgi:hypothetical protein